MRRAWPIADNFFVLANVTDEDLVRLRLFVIARDAAARVAPELAPYVERLRPFPTDPPQLRLS